MTRFRNIISRLIVLLVALWVTAFCCDVLAEDSPISADAPCLWVDVDVGHSALNEAQIRLAIERELGMVTTDRTVPSAIGHVRIELVAEDTALVRYQSTDGKTGIQREVALPSDLSRRALVLSWVTGNLVRNEALEILSELEGRKKPLSPEDNPSTPTVAEPRAEESKGGRLVNEPRVSHFAVTLHRTGFDVAPRAVGRFPVESPKIAHAALVSPYVAYPFHAKSHAYVLSLGGLYSHIGALYGLGISVGIDRIEGPLSGAQIATVVATSDEVSGAQVAGLVGHAGGAVSGAQIAGAAADASANVSGAQIAGAVTLARGNVDGLQLSGVFNANSKVLQGAQISGAFNLARELTGLQLGVVNLTKSSNGAQLGIVNVARRHSGIAFGLVNISKEPRGLELGLVNIAQESHGLQLGLFNWTRGARVSPTYFFQTPGYHNIGYRNIAGHSIGSISFGVDGHRERARTHFALGVFTTIGRLALGCETGYGWVLENIANRATDRAHELDLTGTVSVSVVRKLFDVYVGAGVVQPVAGEVALKPRGMMQAGMTIL